MPESRRAMTRGEWATVVAFGVSAFLIAGGRAMTEPAWPTDFDQMRFAVHALADGRNPYALIGPGREFAWEWGLYYPLPAVLLCAPFAWLPVAFGRVAFATLSGALLGFGLRSRGLAAFPVFLSAAFIIATARTQWSSLLTAAALVPALGGVMAAKPNIGLAVLVGTGSRRLLVMTALTGIALVGLSFLILPSWLVDWLDVVRRGEQKVVPLFTPAGPLMLLSLLRWRRADARLLLAFACIPHTPSLYDLVPLFLVSRTLRETVALALCTHALFLTIVILGPFATFDAYASTLGRLVPVFVFLPATAIVLRRPNIDDGFLAQPALATDATDPAPSTAARLSPRDRIMLTALGTSAAILVWVTMVTRR